MMAASPDGGGAGCGYVRPTRCCEHKALTWQRAVAVGMLTQTGNPRRSPGFQTVRAGMASRGTSDGASGSHCCCCCTSCPGGSGRETSTLLDGPGGPTAGGQM